MRRLTAVLGVLALALMTVPGELATSALDCCNGSMCPMHPVQSHEETCDMAHHQPSAALKPCPQQAAIHYTGATVFVLLSPTVLYRDVRSEPAIALLPNFSPNPELRVDSPPPRLLQKS